jgi:hypothetical protein
MSEEIIGISDQGTGDQTSTEQVTESQVTETQSTEAPTEQVDERTAGLLREVSEVKEKLRRQQEYNNFLKGLSTTPQQQKVQMPELDDDSVPYVQDVKAMIKAEMALARQEAEMERLVEDIRDYGNKQREADKNFDSRMNLANEILRYKPEYAQLIEAQRSAKDIVRVMENIAMEHPMYDTFTVKPVSSNQEAIDRLKANAVLPQTLSGIAGSGQAQKLPSQMTDQEYFEYKEKIKRQA